MRHKFYYLMAAILSVAILSSCQSSPEDRWQQDYEMGVLEYGQSHFNKAESLLALALVEAEKFPENDPRLDSSLNKLIMARAARGKHDTARVLQERLLSMREQTLGTDHLEVGRTLYMLGVLCDWRSRYSESESHYKRALGIFEKHLGPDDEQVYHGLRRLARVYRQTGFFDQAEPLLERVVQMREKKKRPKDEELIKDLSFLIEIYVLRLKYDEAEPLFKRVLKMREDISGKDALPVADILEGYAKLLHETDREVEAVILMERVQAIRNK